MGTKKINPVSVALAGATITKTNTGGSTASIIVAPTTAQSSLNFEDLFVIIENYAASACTVTVKAGDDYSEVGIGDTATITVAASSTNVIGGRELESARFKDSDGYLVLGVSPSSACTVYAVMNPFTALKKKVLNNP